MSEKKQHIGIIGGSGVYKMDGVKIIKEHKVETLYGQPSSEVMEGEIDGVPFYFIPRHGKDHTILPNEVNYRANIFALKELGVKYIISISAVGSLKEEYPPETFILPDQFIDWTKGGRKRSFFGDGIVAHVSTANPINLELQKFLANSCEKLGFSHGVGGTYLCIEGPQFSSKAESALYRSFGATVIGMTNVPESYLAKEAGIAYATVAMVTDYDCWKEEHCTVEEIMKVAAVNNKRVQELIMDVVPALNQNKFEVHSETEGAIMTPYDSLSSDQKRIVDTLLK